MSASVPLVALATATRLIRRCWWWRTTGRESRAMTSSCAERAVPDRPDWVSTLHDSWPSRWAARYVCNSDRRGARASSCSWGPLRPDRCGLRLLSVVGDARRRAAHAGDVYFEL